MALPPTIYRVTIELSDVDRHQYETLNFSVARHPSETAERLLARVWSYALFYDEGLEFTRGVCAGDEPDLWLRRGDGRIERWIEVGLPDPQRLIKAGRHCDQVVLVAYGEAWSRWQETARTSLAAMSNLQLYWLDPALLDWLQQGLKRQIVWQLTRSDGVVYVSHNEQSRDVPFLEITI